MRIANIGLKGLWIIPALIIALGVGCAGPQLAALPLAVPNQLTPPHALLGTAMWEAPVGTEIVAIQGNEELGSATVMADGKFTLLVNQPPGPGSVTFKIGGAQADQVLSNWEFGKIQKDFNLTAPFPADSNTGLAGVDTNRNGIIDLEEVLAVIDAYFDGQPVNIPAPTPTPAATPTPTPTPPPTPTPTPPLPTPTPHPSATIFTGSGDAVRDCNLTTGRKIFTFNFLGTGDYVGSRYFAVDLYDNEGDSTNLIRVYSDSYTGERVIFVGPGLYISSGDCSLQVTADGDWSIYVRE